MSAQPPLEPPANGVPSPVVAGRSAEAGEESPHPTPPVSPHGVHVDVAGAEPPVGPPVGPYRGVPITPNPPPPRRFPLRLAIGAVALVLATGATTYHYVTKPPPPKVARALGARLDLAAGDVVVEGVDGRALSGTPLSVGAVIRTKTGARALVRTGDGAAVFLRENAALALREHGVEVIEGEIWVDAPKLGSEAFVVASGKSTVSAADAGIDVRRAGEDLEVYVARGLAVLSGPGGRVEIGGGEQAKAVGGGKPALTSVKFWNDWTGGMVDQRGPGRFLGSGSGRLYGLDPGAPAGAPAKRLGIARQIVRAVVREGIAETEVDQSFSNPGAAAIEGYYWFTIPPTATVTSFALETDGRLVEGEVIEKRDAAARYEAAVRQANDPALLEWVDGRTYRARIFPVPAGGTRRVVLRYSEMLPNVEGKTRYVYPLRSDDPVRFDEFALSVDVGGTEADFDLATSLDARVEGGRTVSMRRSGFVPRADFQLEMVQKKKRPPARAWRFQAGPDQADYVMLRWAPEQDFAKQVTGSADVVVVVDTSAGGDERARQLRIASAEATLRALSSGDRFALVALDVAPRVLYPKEDLAPASEAEIGRALEKLADHGTGGATDIGAMFEPALARLHGKEQAAIVYVGDGAPTSGETGAEQLIERLRRSLSGSRARFFAIGTGSATSHELLGELARAGGGQYVRVDDASQTTAQSLRLASAIKTPVITDVSLDIGAGLDQPLYSATGKLSRGDELVLLARTHHPLPPKVTVHGRFGGKDFEDKLDLKVDTTSVTAAQVPRLWAAEYARRLMGSGAEENRSQILQLGVEYGLVTPFTSSLALDDEGAYARQGIPRRRTKLRGVRLTAIERAGDEERLLEGILPAAPAVMVGCGMDKSSPSASAQDDERSRPASAPPVALGVSPADPHAPPANAPVSDTMPRRVAEETPASPVVAASAAPTPPPPPRSAPPGKPSPGPVANAQLAKSDEPDKSGKRDKVADRRPSDETRTKSPLPSNNARPAVLRALALCSDLGSRPLAERALVWHKRAKKAATGDELAALYDSAYRACELPDWQDEAALLDILSQRIETEQTAETFLAHIAQWPDAQRFVARNILRRTVDIRIAAAVGRALHHGVDWARVDNELAATESSEKQQTIVKAAMLQAPSDPQGDLRWVRVLARSGQRNEAIAHGRRLRDRGFMTPTLAQSLGDVLAESGAEEEALRTYSEIVEFNGGGAAARRLLGDIYLRRGWHAAAYRQYKTLTDIDAKDPLSWLRLAAAAAGAGRIDEALHIEREVAAGEGTPGPNDPRVFARMLSASRLATLLATPDPAAGATPEAVGRKLKELSLFSGPGTLTLLVWDDLEARLSLGAADPKRENLAGESTDAGAVGLFALLGTGAEWERTPRAVKVTGDPLGRPVRYRLLTLAWDGASFSVTTKEGKVEARAKLALL